MRHGGEGDLGIENQQQQEEHIVLKIDAVVHLHRYADKNEDHPIPVTKHPEQEEGVEEMEADEEEGNSDNGEVEVKETIAEGRAIDGYEETGQKVGEVGVKKLEETKVLDDGTDDTRCAEEDVAEEEAKVKWTVTEKTSESEIEASLSNALRMPTEGQYLVLDRDGRIRHYLYPQMKKYMQRSKYGPKREGHETTEDKENTDDRKGNGEDEGGRKEEEYTIDEREAKEEMETADDEFVEHEIRDETNGYVKKEEHSTIEETETKEGMETEDDGLGKHKLKEETNESVKNVLVAKGKCKCNVQVIVEEL